MELEVSQSQLQMIGEILNDHGINEYGFAELDGALSLDRYKSWVAQGLHGDMDYLRRHTDIKQNPAKKYGELRSAIVFRQHYFNFQGELPGVANLKLALYAMSPDYHLRIPQSTEPLIAALQKTFPKESFACHTDSGPVLERDLAYRAGLGWFGKNSMLIDEKKGSFFFIAEILTSMHLKSSAVLQADRCGTCTRCIDACPTDAILPDRLLDARKCISYLTIESKTTPPEELRSGIGDNFFGCDICQLVCPWNEKAFGKVTLKELVQVPHTLSNAAVTELHWILAANDADLKETFKTSPLQRPKPWGLRRNALVVVGNYVVSELRPMVLRHAEDPRLSDLVEWVLERFDSK